MTAENGSEQPLEQRPEAGPEERPSQSRLPATVTMPLLTRITQSSLDEDYVHAARNREAGEVRRHRGGRAMVVAVVVVFGLMLGVAAIETARDRDTTEAGRQVLIQRIEAEKAHLASLQRRIGRTTKANREMGRRYTDLGRKLSALTARNEDVADITGFGASSGPGVRIVVDNAKDATYATDDPGLVHDSDLNQLVNGLWDAGATAIAVNGQRVTALSAFRNSGPVIRINNTSLSAPYEIKALGDNRTLQADFALTNSGAAFDRITREVGIPVTMENVDRLDIPAGSRSKMVLHYAEPAPTKK